MNILKHYILPVLTLLALAGCTDRAYSPDAPDGPDKNRARLTLSISTSSAPSSRADSKSNDTDIRNLMVLMFRPDPDNARTPGTLWRALEGKNLSDEFEPGKRSFDVTYGIDPTDVPGSLVVVVVANANSYLQQMEAAAESSWTYAQVQSALHDDFNTRMASDTLPLMTFWGIADRNVDTSLRAQAVRVTLLRDLAKTCLRMADERDDERHFRLAAMLVYNRADGIRQIPALASIRKEGSGVALPTPDPTASMTECPEYTALPFETDPDSLRLYLPEQDVLMKGDGDPADANRFKRPAVIVGGYYRGNPGRIFWYRVDFLDKEKKLIDVLRNHSYNINVTAVNGPGEDTPEEAYHSLTTHVEAEILDWENMDSEAAFDGGNWIALPKPVSLTGQAGAKAEISLLTNVAPDTWEAAWVAGDGKVEEAEFSPCGGKTISNGDFEVTFPAELDTEGGVALSVKAVTALPEGVEKRSALLYINVTPRLRLAVPVTQSRGSADENNAPWGENNIYDQI